MKMPGFIEIMLLQLCEAAQTAEETQVAPSYLLADFLLECPFCILHFCLTGWVKPCFFHFLPISVQVPFISHSSFKLFFTHVKTPWGGRVSCRWNGSGSTRAHHKAEFESLVTCHARNLSEGMFNNFCNYFVIRFLDTYKHHQDATCQHPDKNQLFSHHVFAVCRAS